MRILYAQHVAWTWAWQRPHEVARQLAFRHELLVVAPTDRRAERRLEQPVVAETFSLPTWPGSRFTAIGLPCDIRRRGLVAQRVDRFSPDVLWLTHPSSWGWVARYQGAFVVYDCMDDVWDEGRRIRRLESDLLRASDLVITSSDRLAAVLDSRYGKESVVIHNAGPDSIVASVDRPTLISGSAVKALYVGTIGWWMDFELIVHALGMLPWLSVDLVGPQMVSIPDHPRLRHRGVHPHGELADLSSDFDVLLMPFLVNDLVEGVDPVKLYEYLSWRRPVVAPDYSGLDRFRPLCNLYQDHEEFIAVLRGVRDGSVGLPPREAVSRFLLDNCWSRRGDQIEAALGSLTGSGRSTDGPAS